MFTGNRIALSILGGFALLAAGCSSGGGGDVTASLSSAVQDLTVDPEGVTTVITLSTPVLGITAGNVQASGGQTAQVLSTNGSALTVTWSDRVTPSHSVRVVGVTGLSSSWRAVTTTDSSAPTFTIDGATQSVGLGGDEIEVTFAGPGVVESTVEDPANWVLVVNSNTLDLSLSTFEYDPLTRVLDVTLSPLANLHASFTLAAPGVLSVADVPVGATAVAGAATGDTTAPNLLTAEQNLTEDEFGRVVDFTFDEAMDPVDSLVLSRFSIPSPNTATQVEQISEDVLRVSFATPVIPGEHEVTLTGLLDAHGNALTDGPTAITQPSPVANDFDGDPEAVTVENRDGDFVTFTTLQAFDVASAEDPTSWILEVDSVVVDLTAQTLTYDFLSKTLVVELDFDMVNGTAFTITGNGTLEVDGQAFSGTFSGTVAGDAVEPTVTDVTQNRNIDPTGVTLQVTFSETVQATAAEDEANYTLSDGGITVLSASLLPNGSLVRLTLDAVALPGTVTLTVDGILDLAGNAMSAPQLSIPIASTDVTPPALMTAVATAVEGALNDTLLVTFSDDMIAAEIEDLANWSFETPIGSSRDLTGSTVTYNDASRSARVVFDAGGIDLLRDTDFRVDVTGVQDIGGNEILSAPFDGDVDFEGERPTIVSIWRDSVQTDQIEVRFSEPCAQLDDLYDAITNPTGTRYTVYDGLAERGTPIGAVPVDDGLGVILSFGFIVDLTDTLDVYGVSDLAGNYMLPIGPLPIQDEDGSTPSFDVGFSTLTAVSGEENDVITFVFDVPMSPWGLLDHEKFTVSSGGQPVPMERGRFSFDGDRTVTVLLENDETANLQASSIYSATVNGVQSAQGVERLVQDVELNIGVAGDALAPTVSVLDVLIDPLTVDSLLVFSDEALDAVAATTAAAYDYDAGTLAMDAEQLSPRVVRVTFPAPVTVGGGLAFTLTDLAGNVSGTINRVVNAADAAAPLLASVGGVSVPGIGGDLLSIAFDESVDPAAALDAASYTVTNGGSPVSLASATFGWESSTFTVRIRLADGVELDPSQPLSITVRDVTDWSGNAISSGGVTLAGAVTGDTTVPAVAGSFVNWREDELGTTVDVVFVEDVVSSFSGDTLNWSSSGGQTVTDVQVLDQDSVRVTLSAPLSPGDELQLAGGLADPAGNVAGPLSFEPAS